MLLELATIDVGRLTEDEARNILEAIRWPGGPRCTHCGAIAVTRLSNSNKHRDGLLQCNVCRGQFSVILGTVMQGSHITLRQWVQAFHSMWVNKRVLPAARLQRDIELGSYRSAWMLSKRLKAAIHAEPFGKHLTEATKKSIVGKPRKGRHFASNSIPVLPTEALALRDAYASEDVVVSLAAKLSSEMFPRRSGEVLSVVFEQLQVAVLRGLDLHAIEIQRDIKKAVFEYWRAEYDYNAKSIDQMREDFAWEPVQA